MSESSTTLSANDVDSANVNTHRELVDEALVKLYFCTALTFLTVAMLAGLHMALQLIRHNPMRGIELFSPGRWRMLHTNAIAYGFLANGFIGALHWICPD